MTYFLGDYSILPKNWVSASDIEILKAHFIYSGISYISDVSNTHMLIVQGETLARVEPLPDCGSVASISFASLEAINQTEASTP